MANRGPSPSMMQMQQHGPPHGPVQQPPPPPPPPAHQGHFTAPSRQLQVMNEQVWIAIGNLEEQFNDLPEAMVAYERALRANSQSIPAMIAMSLLLRGKEDFQRAIEYLQVCLNIDTKNGEAWGSLGHCYLMMDDLENAYRAYQNALAYLANPKEPKLWYGIGILYDRHGSLEHAEEAFSHVMNMDPHFEKANEIYFRLGIIYKQGQKYAQSLECFKYIVNNPPPPLTEEDVWFQIGHVYEQHKDFENARSAYQRVLERDPNHAKVLQQLGWLHHQESDSFGSQDRAIEYLEKSVTADQQDAQSWYLLGRCYMSQNKFSKAYEAYQQAVYRDGRNPTFWCSIGVLYYQINQYRDALDAYSRAIRLNPYISEVWYDLGTLYESCNNQINDAIDAYKRAAELDPNNHFIKSRLALLRNGGGAGAQGAPQPADVQPQAYPPTGPPPPQWQGSGPVPAQPPVQPPVLPNGWQGRLSEVNPPPHPPNPFDSREYRGPPPGPAPPMVRPPSPRQDGPLPPHQQYPEHIRPGPMRRDSSPPPPQSQPLHYQQGPPPQSGSRPGLGPGPGPGPASGPPAPMQGPSYSGPAPPMGRAMGPAPPTSLPHFRSTNSPRSDARQFHDNRMPSPKSAYPQHPPPPPPYGHRPDQGPPQPGVGSAPLAPSHPPPPPSNSQAMIPGEAGLPARADDQPASVGPKRMREWDEEPAPKKQAIEENRVRLEDVRHGRPSTPTRNEPYRRNSAETHRLEEQRRIDDQRRVEEMRRPDELRHVNEGYHPSEAAHHPPSHSMGHQQPVPFAPMPSILHPTPNSSSNAPGSGPTGPGPSPVPLSTEFQKDDRALADHPPVIRQGPPPPMNEPERAARAVDVNEDYDDTEDEDQKKGSARAGSGAGSGADKKPASPSVVAPSVGPKVES